MILNASQIISAVQGAFNTAAAQSPPQAVAPAQIGDGCTLRVDVYAGPAGTGFAVTAVTVFGQFPNLGSAICCMQSGPEPDRQQNATMVPLLIALLLAQYARLPAWAQEYFTYEKNAIAARLAVGDVDGALCITQATDVPDSLAANQAAILALFPTD
jgi:hypothetical protein